MTDDEKNIDTLCDALLKYYNLAASKNTIDRVEPCILATIDKIEAVRKCCEAVIAEDSRKSDVGEALMGCISILGDIKAELYQASDILADKLHEVS